MRNRTPERLTPEQWQTVIQGLESRPSTVNDYRKVLNLLHAYDNETLHIFEMNKEQAELYFQYLDQREADGTLSTNTVHRYKATLRSIGTRIEQSKMIPGYTNPFSRLVSNESRKRTEFRSDMFADPRIVQLLRDAMPGFSKENRLILSLMMNIGMTPSQIQNLSVSDFAFQPQDQLTVRINEGNFIEQTSEPWKESPYYKQGYPVHFVRKSPNRSITWSYTGTFNFNEEFSDILQDYYEYVGVSTDTRSFFLTARHLEFNYRAMHHMVLDCCHQANIDTRLITPNMISRYGMIQGYLLYTALEENKALKERIAHGENCSQQLADNERRLATIRENGDIGTWKDHFPIPLQERIDAIKNTLGEEFLPQATGITFE